MNSSEQFQSADTSKRNRIIAICLALAALTLAVYWPVTTHQFINFDDSQYLTENYHVRDGLTWSGVVWAFGSSYAENWHPVTWISHMVDCQLFGLNPWGHHLVSLLFHVANSVLLFLLLRQMTGALWRCAAVAALFAWHPLHVESVAWAAERKDVLSTLFWILTLMAYVKYVRQPSARRYGLALFLFALGLMSKPMVVTLPFVLLLLDFWPLGRLRLPGFGANANNPLPAQAPKILILEKLPFFALTIAASCITFAVQHSGGAVASFKAVPFTFRIANALLTYLRYLGKTIWPEHLAVVYPYPHQWSIAITISTALVLAAGSVFLILAARRRPYLITGWFWYLGTLVPTIGLVQVGSQSMADRYMYIPSIGVFILGVWGLADLFKLGSRRQMVLAVPAIIALAACMVLTWIQLKYWQNSERLFRRTMEVTTNNFVACTALGGALDELGRKEEALSLYAESVRMEPHFPEGQYNLGTALLDRGRLDEAIDHFTLALKDDPRYALAHNNLGKALRQQGKLEDAAAHLATAVKLAPDDPEAHFNLGTLYLIQSKIPAAAAEFSEALRLRPDYKEAHSNLAVLLMNQRRPNEALQHFAAAARLDPANPEAHFNLGLALLEQGTAFEATAEFQEALRLKPGEARFHYRLAIALHSQQRPAEAIQHYREALRLQPDYPDALVNLAWILSSNQKPELRSGEEAVRLAGRACELTGREQAGPLMTLAAAYAEAGRFPDAIATVQKARDLALAANLKEVAAQAGELEKLFQSGRPVREAF